MVAAHLRRDPSNGKSFATGKKPCLAWPLRRAAIQYQQEKSFVTEDEFA
jgi:hypothetical protein